MTELSLAARLRVILARMERPLSFEAILGQIDEPRKIVRDTLNQMVRRGILRRTATGRYGVDRTPRENKTSYPTRGSVYDKQIMAALLIEPMSARELAEALQDYFPNVRPMSLQLRINDRLNALESDGRVTHDEPSRRSQPRKWNRI